MEKMMNGLYTYVTTFQPFLYLLVAVVLIIVGILLIIPSEKTKHMAITSLPFIAIGSGLVILASNLATELTSAFTF